MPQLFPPNSNSFVTWAVWAGGIFAVLMIVALPFYARVSNNAVGVPVAQPIDYPHNLHVVQVGLDCRYCHTTVETSNTASVPPTETCMGCHSQLRVGTPQVQAVVDSWNSGTPIAWNRVNELADYVYFNHSAHVNNGVGCSTCHGRMDEMAQVWKNEPLTMGWCLECHRNPATALRPVSEVFNMAYQPLADPKAQLALGATLVEAYHIDTDKLTQCSTCHR
ncbi:MAG: cytochrome c3 family protein [Trueperaceae bacterium]|jgi:hypothetical protein|nr:cytochrome c3 family protein [Trueperaceae bacterium]MCC6312156.1 cytochrome c3 family protein [Trueperaceae bacterium]MCO5172811.1 cytochrome C [Trueperaceae bacterium]MCW5819935.1 cytochrome c3 family protein [Trueperaceae bacterium]